MAKKVSAGTVVKDIRRQTCLSNWVFGNYKAILDAACEACRPGRF